ncbi:MAG: redoxin domain-containing protein [Planctomycetaceae bacterium]
MRTRFLATCVTAISLSLPAAWADEMPDSATEHPADAREVQPLEVGEAVPDAKLHDATGTETTLHKALGQQLTAIVFYRGHWCPICSRHTQELKSIQPQLKAAGVQLIAISPDTPEFVEDTHKTLEVPFPLYSDSDLDVIDAFGLGFVVDPETRQKYKGFGIDLEKSSGQQHHVLPVPAVYLIDADGKVVFRHYDPDYRQRLSRGEAARSDQEIRDFVVIAVATRPAYTRRLRPRRRSASIAQFTWGDCEMLLRSQWLMCWLVIFAGGAAADNVMIQRDVVYGHKDGMAATFDVLTPAAPNGAAVLHLQSGGWYSAWRPAEQLVPAAEPFLAQGYTVLVVRHGSAPRYQVPDAVADVRRCVRYVRMHADDLGIDADRLGVWGGSAGGHLTLMLATTGDDGDPNSEDPVLRASSRIKAGVSLFPPTDLRGWTTDPPKVIADVPGLKPPLQFDAALESSVSPILHVTRDDAAVLLIHGDQDLLVPIEHSHNIVPKFSEQQVPHELLVIAGAAHGFSPEQTRERVVPAMVGWFDKHLAP